MMIFVVHPLVFISASEKEMNENFLKRLEEDQEREMRQLEEKIRREVSLATSFRSKTMTLSHPPGTSEIQYGA